MPSITHEINKDDDIFSFNLSDEDIFDLNLFEHDIFNVDRLIAESNNQRKSVRYVRKDITASINQADIFGGYSLFSHSRSIFVKLLDISSKGALIASPHPMKLKQKILLTLVFNTNKKFEIPARIIRETHSKRKMYGIQFEKTNDDLGDYLLETQTDLIFS